MVLHGNCMELDYIQELLNKKDLMGSWDCLVRNLGRKICASKSNLFIFYLRIAKEMEQGPNGTVLERLSIDKTKRWTTK